LFKREKSLKAERENWTLLWSRIDGEERRECFFKEKGVARGLSNYTRRLPRGRRIKRSGWKVRIEKVLRRQKNKNLRAGSLEAANNSAQKEGGVGCRVRGNFAKYVA